MHTPQVITNGVDYIFLIIPVVVVLFGWIGAVYWADAHPDVRHVGSAPGQAIPGQPGTEATLAAGAADENQPEAGQRIAAATDAAGAAGATARSESERSGDA